MKKYLLFFSLLSLASTAIADSFWDHNGSIMRLEASDNKRTFTYEKPSEKMQNIGVIKGTVLFNGIRKGDKYYGAAHVFSKYCDYSLPYDVSGTVYNGPQVVLTGTRPNYSRECLATEKTTTDTLTFIYLRSE
jgi:hypothetical protein